MRSLQSKSAPLHPIATERRRYKSRKTASGERMDNSRLGRNFPDYTDFAYREAVGKLKAMLTDSYVPSQAAKYHGHHHESDDESGVSFLPTDSTRLSRLGAHRRPFATSFTTAHKSVPRSSSHEPLHTVTSPSTTNQPELLNFIERQEEYIDQLEKEAQYCRDELSQLLVKVKDLISENESLHAQSKMPTARHMDSYNDRKLDVYETKIRDSGGIGMESRIAELEAQLTQVRLDLKKSQEEANMYKKKMLENDPTSSSSEFYRQIESLHREKRELSDSLSKLQAVVNQLREKESDSSRKVLRTQDVAEKAQCDRQQAEMEVQRLKSELDHQHQRLLDVLSEQTRKVAEERSQAERRYLQHVEQLSAELSIQRDAAAKVQMELDRHLRIEDDLRRDLAAKSVIAENIRKELNAKITSLQTELAAALTERDALEQELSTNRMSGERSERACRQEVSRLQVEVNALRQRIERNDTELTQARRENLRQAEQISELESEVTLYKGRLGELDDEGNIKRASTVRELEEVVKRQSQAMSQLNQQCQTLTNKLDDSSSQHKEEMEQLQSRLEFLTSRLETSIINQTSAAAWQNDHYEEPAPAITSHIPEEIHYDPPVHHQSNLSLSETKKEVTPPHQTPERVAEDKILTRRDSRMQFSPQTRQTPPSPARDDFSRTLPEEEHYPEAVQYSEPEQPYYPPDQSQYPPADPNYAYTGDYENPQNYEGDIPDYQQDSNYQEQNYPYEGYDQSGYPQEPTDQEYIHQQNYDPSYVEETPLTSQGYRPGSSQGQSGELARTRKSSSGESASLMQQPEDFASPEVIPSSIGDSRKVKGPRPQGTSSSESLSGGEKMYDSGVESGRPRSVARRESSMKLSQKGQRNTPPRMQ